MHTQTITVAQVGIGPIGAEILRLILTKPWLKLVAAVDIDPAKLGKDVAEIIGLDQPTGVIVSNELTTHPQVVCHSTASDIEAIAPQLDALLAAGSHVISTCEELAFVLSTDVRESLQKTARRSNVALLGTGVNPGFIMDKLPLTLSAVCERIDSIEVTRIVDASTRRESLQRKIGAGMSAEEFRRDGVMHHAGFRESLVLIANALGRELEEIGEPTFDPIIAADGTRSQHIEIQNGNVSGFHHRIEGRTRDGITIALDLTVAIGAKDARDEIRIKGVPDVELVIRGGIDGDRAAAAMAVNAIPRLFAARPGVLTMDDIPISYR